MVSIVGKYLYSRESYDHHDFDDAFLSKSLPHLIFDQRKSRCFNKERFEGRMINAGKNLNNFMTYESMEKQSRIVASALKEFGVTKESSILVMVQNNVNYFNFVLGSWYLGASVSMTSPNLSPANLSKQLSAVNMKVIFCNECSLNNVAEGIEMFMRSSPDHKAPIHLVVVTDEELAEAEGGDFLKIKTYSSILKSFEPIEDSDCQMSFNRNNPTTIFWSSGTTGDPKGVVLDFSYLLRMINFEDTFFNAPNNHHETFLVTTNMFHIGGFFFTLLNGLRNGHDIVIFSPDSKDALLTVDDIFQSIHDFKPSLVIVASHHAALLSQRNPSNPSLDLSSVSKLYPFGTSNPKNLQDELRKNFINLDEVLTIYGMTETNAVSVSKNPDSLGFLLKGNIVRIVDVEKSSEDNYVLLGPNKVGEIQIKTPFMVSRYLDGNGPQKESFFTKDGFGRSGDLCSYNEDGELFFKSRLKELIKYNGNHLYPGELEAIISSHPAVSDVAVFGIPNPEVQEYVAALVVPKPGFTITEEEIIQCVISSGVESFKYIRGGVKFVTELPKNPTGKTMRRFLVDIFKSI